jgi:hypothetical protein
MQTSSTRLTTNLPYERLDATRTTVDLVKSDLTDDLAAVLSAVLLVMAMVTIMFGWAYFRSVLI